MTVDKSKLFDVFIDLEDELKNYSLPNWEELPDIELYMDQVITLLEKYLEFHFNTIEDKKKITPSMINNYVKLNIIPPPTKKKYNKNHLAYLLVVCTLKQTLDMATIQKIMPADLKEEEIKQIYSAFVSNQQKAYLFATDNVRSVVQPILDGKVNIEDKINDLLMQSASTANFYKILTETITKFPIK